MDWSNAILINKQALTRFVVELVALLVAQGEVLRLPKPVYKLIVRSLLPVESTLRRLIVMAARGLVLPAAQPRKAAGSGAQKGRGKGGSRPMAFRLFDKRKRFREVDDVKSASTNWPRIRSIDLPSPREQFLAQFKNHPAIAGTVSEARTTRLRRRLAAVSRALEDLPREARRMARWKSRRAEIEKEKPAFTCPLRPGRAPGHIKRSKDELHLLLKECHALARWALEADTS